MLGPPDCGPHVFPGNPPQHHPPTRDTENEAKAAGMFSGTLSIIKGTSSTEPNTFTPELVSVQVTGHEWGRKDRERGEGREKRRERGRKREKEGKINYLLLLLHIPLAERREERPSTSAIGVTQVSCASLGSPEK